MIVPTNYLKAVLLASAKKDIRYYLNSVLVNSKHLVGTDGHRMHVVAHGQEGWDHGDVIIPRDAVEMALKGRSADITITPSTIGVVSFKETGGTYPNYTRLMLTSCALPSMGALIANVLPEYLVDARKAIALVSGHKHTALSRINDMTWAWSDGKIQTIVMGQRGSEKAPLLSPLTPML